MRPNRPRPLYKIMLLGLALLAGHGALTVRPAPEAGGELAPAVPGLAAATTEVFPFREVDAAYDHSCGVRTDGVVACWGNGENGKLDVPAGTFGQVSTGEDHSCGVKTDGTLTCWGRNRYGKLDAPTGTFRQVSAGADHSCGLKTDDRVACWGDDADGKLDAPDGAFSRVSAGYEHTCGVRKDGTVVCWGNNDAGQANAPKGTFSEVSAGEGHTCGVQTDGTVTCWGNNDAGQLGAPSGRFSQVSAGTYHSCGLTAGGTVSCWGTDTNGRLDVPGGRFSGVSAGPFHTCGVRVDGTLACWGSRYHGEATPPVPPTLSQQPRSTRVVTGAPFTLSVTASGSGTGYQWRKDGTEIGGETGSSYTAASASATDSGSYDVLATNVAGRITSEAATVVVVPPPDAPTPADTRTLPTDGAPFRRQRKKASRPRASAGWDGVTRVAPQVLLELSTHRRSVPKPPPRPARWITPPGRVKPSGTPATPEGRSWVLEARLTQVHTLTPRATPALRRGFRALPDNNEQMKKCSCNPAIVEVAARPHNPPGGLK